MSARDHGGPAFPGFQFSEGFGPTRIAEGPGNNPVVEYHDAGMSLRDYFAAHAPAEPQSWFKPVMVLPEPKRPAYLVDPTPEEKGEISGFDEILEFEELKQPRVRAYVSAIEEYRRASAEWNTEHTKQRFVQWPAAWADAVLNARSA